MRVALAFSTLPSNQSTGCGVGSGPVMSLKSLLFPSRVVACHKRTSLGGVFVCKVMEPPSTPCRVGQHSEVTPIRMACKTHVSDGPRDLREGIVLRGGEHHRRERAGSMHSGMALEGEAHQEYGGVEGIGIKKDAGKVSSTAVLCIRQCPTIRGRGKTYGATSQHTVEWQRESPHLMNLGSLSRFQ